LVGGGADPADSPGSGWAEYIDRGPNEAPFFHDCSEDAATLPDKTATGQQSRARAVHAQGALSFRVRFLFLLFVFVRLAVVPHDSRAEDEGNANDQQGTHAAACLAISPGAANGTKGVVGSEQRFPSWLNLRREASSAVR
jgi:hypothetical protein